jgi:hypothetical protein
MPVAGLFKRLKNIGSKAFGGLNTINQLYKQFEPILGPILDSVPYGSVIKEGARALSKGIDTANTIKDRIKES